MTRQMPVGQSEATKIEKIDVGAPEMRIGAADGVVAPKRRSWELPENLPGTDRFDLATDIMNIMEQGIVVWSADGYCQLHNTRVFSLLELKGGDLEIGTRRQAFRDRAVARGEMSNDSHNYSQDQISAHQPYAFDRILPSGRVVLTNGRPIRGGGYVVTFTDVTDARAAEKALSLARQQAEDARAQAVEIMENERARRNESRLLTSLDEWLQSCKSLDELFLIVRRYMERLLPGSEGELYVYSNSRDALEGMCQWNTTAMHSHIAADTCWGLRRGRVYLHAPEEISFKCDHVLADDSRALRYVCVPIMAHGDTVGLLHIRLNPEARGELADPVAFAVQCGEHISMAIANVKLRDELRDQSVRDALTGLYNRRFFMSALDREVAIAMRRATPLGLISFDADKFKSFNDTYGHEAGDMVLRAIGRTVAEIAAGNGTACRIGGEEFAMLLPGHDAAATAALAEQMRAAIEATLVRSHDGTQLHATVSLGVSCCPDHGDDPRILMRRADAALYLAKEEGRNCVRLAH